jgi:ADP-ribosylglycohydrolase
MVSKESAYRGCLLGLAVGDALGYAVDGKTREEIIADYGPEGLRGYDLVNGYADVTSYTQMAAYAAGGLLVGLTQGQLQGKMAPFVRYIGLGLREWSEGQRTYRTPERSHCWVAQVPQLRRRRCMDTRMLDRLNRGDTGTPEAPKNDSTHPGSLTNAVAVGLFFDPQRMNPRQIGPLGAEAVALTHGDPGTFLSGAVLAYVIAGIIQDPDTALQDHFTQAAQVVAVQFGGTFPQAVELKHQLARTRTLANNGSLSPRTAMEHLKCTTAPEVLAGAMYACLKNPGDFDAAMVTAVNHSGRSCAVGAVAGAVLGAALGEEALPEFYLECLEPAGTLRILADDLRLGCPMGKRAMLFDDTWDHKYVQGLPPEKDD